MACAPVLHMMTLALIFLNSATRSEKAMISVGQTNVKSCAEQEAKRRQSGTRALRCGSFGACLRVKAQHRPLAALQRVGHADGLDLAVDDR